MKSDTRAPWQRRFGGTHAQNAGDRMESMISRIQSDAEVAQRPRPKPHPFADPSRLDFYALGPEAVPFPIGPKQRQRRR